MYFFLKFHFFFLSCNLSVLSYPKIFSFPVPSVLITYVSKNRKVSVETEMVNLSEDRT